MIVKKVKYDKKIISSIDLNVGELAIIVDQVKCVKYKNMILLRTNTNFVLLNSPYWIFELDFNIEVKKLNPGEKIELIQE